MSAPTLAPAAIALNRFGLGARPDEAIPSDPKAWLLGQMDRFEVRPAPFAALDDPAQVVVDYFTRQRADAQAARAAQAMAGGAASPPMAGATAMPAAGPPGMMPATAPTDAVKLALQADRKQMRRDAQGLYRAAVNARAESALTTPAPFVERLVHFWANHFAVSAEKPEVVAYAGAFEYDAIRPHVLGRFEDMLLAAERHPAMMLYLDQARSIGPNSAFAQRVAARRPGSGPGLNENLAREIMELHTLGVRSGYTQADVTDFARAMTGWSIGGYRGGKDPLEAGPPGAFLFRPATHEPGERVILGRHYPDSGEFQARTALTDFAAAPATATHIATKLARHFAGDAPPPAMVDRLAAAFTASKGDLPTVYRAIIASPEAWAPQPAKFKTPWEWTISSLRGLGRMSLDQMQIAPLLTQLGQPTWKPGSPAGWDDVAASWAAPDALIRRVELAQRLAAPSAAKVDARALAPKLIPAGFAPMATEQIARAESPAAALALLLVSPDFLRR